MKYKGKGDGEGRSVSGLLSELEPNGRVQYKAYIYMVNQRTWIVFQQLHAGMHIIPFNL